MKHLAIFGSTGSIGRNALRIVEQFPDRFTVDVLAAKKSVDVLARQIERFQPRMAVLHDRNLARELEARIQPPSRVKILYGQEGYTEAAVYKPVDTVVAAMVGAAGLPPTMAAISAGKKIALANKETLVMAGGVVMAAAQENGVSILPIDSEHSAIFQCLQGNRKKDVDRVLLTGSGGPFRTLPKERFAQITVEDALNHPNWRMGPKITVDSSTLMNKGLEVIEAKWLFGVSEDRIQVLIHPESIVHSMVAFRDGSVVAQLGVPDMKGAIAYALSHPERLPLGQPVPDFAAIGALHFENPDLDKFPCLAMAFEACRKGHTMPAVMNGANEIAVAAFLQQRISHVRIFEVVKETMDGHGIVENPTVSDIMEADRRARQRAEMLIQDPKH